MFSLLGVPGLVGLTLAVAACGGSGSSSPPPTIPPGALAVYAGPGLQLDQPAYTIAATNGQVTIAYVNRDTQRHTLVVVDSSGITQGTKLEINKSNDESVGTFSLPAGQYKIGCEVPGHGAMKATLTVT